MSRQMKTNQRRPDYRKTHQNPLPLQTYPLPALVPHNPLSLLRILWIYFSQSFFSPASHVLRDGAVKPNDGRETYVAFYDSLTNSVQVTSPIAVRALWEQGFFGKGNLSRSEPQWLEREKRKEETLAREANLAKKSSQFSADATNRRRQERSEMKRERARNEALALEQQLEKEAGEINLDSPKINAEAGAEVESAMAAVNGTPLQPANKHEKMSESFEGRSSKVVHDQSNLNSSVRRPQFETKEIANQEHLQLNPCETLFLTYGLGILTVVNPQTNAALTTAELLSLFCRTSHIPSVPQLSTNFEPDNTFLLQYVVYHHFRSLGWVVRPGNKFAVDFLLYNRGPVFAHAEFAIMILPSYSSQYWHETEDRRKYVERKERRDWWWLHCTNRVQTQVQKTLVLVYVDIPPPLPGAEYDVQHLDIGGLLRRYQVYEFIIRRWSLNRNRD